MALRNFWSDLTSSPVSLSCRSLVNEGTDGDERTDRAISALVSGMMPNDMRMSIKDERDGGREDEGEDEAVTVVEAVVAVVWVPEDGVMYMVMAWEDVRASFWALRREEPPEEEEDG